MRADKIIVDDWDTPEHMAEDLENAERILSEPFNPPFPIVRIYSRQVFGTEAAERMREALATPNSVLVLSTEDSFEWVDRGGRPYSNHLDIKYPHICFKCKRKLKFIELYGINREYSEAFNMPLYKRLKKLWKSPYVEFYCCVCFNLNALNKSLGF